METGKKKAIVIGASSGIGRALAKVLAQAGYEVGLTARRIELLAELQKELPARSFVKKMDLADAQNAIRILEGLIREMGGLDLMVVNAGVNIANPDLEFDPEAETIKVNVTGFVAMADTAIRQFAKQGSGHLVGISSVASLRGSGRVPSYNASKAFMSIYLAGLRQRLAQSMIHITEIRPGYVRTPMISHMKGVFGAASPDKAARQILDAIRKKKKVAYVTKRWFFLAQLFKIIPDTFYDWGYRILNK